MENDAAIGNKLARKIEVPDIPRRNCLPSFYGLQKSRSVVRQLALLPLRVVAAAERQSGQNPRGIPYAQTRLG